MQDNTTDLNYEEEVKLAKFESLIDIIKNQIDYYNEPVESNFGDTLGFVSMYGSRISSAISNNTKSSIVATGIILIFNAIELNSYSDIINQKFTLRFARFRNNASYNFDVPEDIKERISK